MEKRIFVVDLNSETEEKKIQMEDKKPEIAEAKFAVDELGNVSIKPSNAEMMKKIQKGGKEFLNKMK